MAIQSTLFVVFFFLAVAAATSCSQQWECQSFSENFNYVTCANGQCQCKSNLGFIGNATASNKCRCPYQVYWGNGNPYCKNCVAPRQIIYQNNMPYCVNGAESEANALQEENNAIRKQKITELYLGLRPPGAILVMTGQMDVSHIFERSVVRGRVTPVGSFNSFDGVLEYFYGLASTTFIPVLNFPSLVADGNKVGVRVDLLFNSTGQPIHNLTQTGFFTFNSDNRIISFDLSILNLGAIIDPPEQARPLVIQQVCSVLLLSPRTCAPGTYTGSYTDFNDCVSFMSSIPYGSWNRANSNTFTCRQLHTLLTPFRPAVHCPHAGKTGGGACQDFPYNSFYLNDYP